MSLQGEGRTLSVRAIQDKNERDTPQELSGQLRMTTSMFPSPMILGGKVNGKPFIGVQSNARLIAPDAVDYSAK
jgi:hypothetical protein